MRSGASARGSADYGVMRASTGQFAGPALTAVVLLVFVVLDAAVVRIQNPAPIFLIAVTFAGYVGGLRPALVSAALAIGFSTYYFAIPGQPFTYTPSDQARLVSIVLGTMAIAALTGILRERLVRAERSAARARESSAVDSAGSRLRDSETRLRATVDVALDALIAMDTTGRITDWNPSAEETFGYQRGDILGQEMAATIIPERYRKSHRDGLRRFLETGEGRVIGKRIEIEALHADGHEFPIELAISPVRTSAGLSFTAFVRDISSRRRLEAVQTTALAEVRQALQLRDDFLSAAAHDLKTPLTAIKGHLQLMKRRFGDALPPGVAASFSEVDRSATRMNDLINELLDVARLQSGQSLSLDRRQTDLVALVRAVVESTTRRAPRHSVEIETVTPTLIGRWDPVRIERVLTNLVTNAVKYSPEKGQITVSISPDREGSADWAVVAVRDRGIGIPASDIPRLFTRFYRASNVVGVEGTGIGLEAARRMVEQHGGTISVESTEGSGTTVTVRLPLEQTS